MKNKKIVLGILTLILMLVISFQNGDLNLSSKKSSPAIKSAQDTQHFLSVSDIIDGDTLTDSRNKKLRLVGVNAPEKGQPYSREAQKYLTELTLGKEIRLEYDVNYQDMYGRELVYIFQNSLFINEEIVKAGFAIVETIPPNVKYAERLLASQQEARRSCRGLWSGLCSADSPSQCISISTIRYDARGDDVKNKNDEWIEFKNICQSTVQLTGYLLKDNSASNSFTFPEFSLGAGSIIRLHSGCGVNTIQDLYWKCPEVRSPIWNNTGDHAYLYSNEKKLVADFGY